jgi:hypothetical protein
MTSKLVEQKGKSAASKKVTTLQASKSAGKGKLSANTKAQSRLASGTLMPDERRRMIAEAAYYRAEQHGFNPEQQEQDWLEAESMVDSMLSDAASKYSDLSH